MINTDAWRFGDDPDGVELCTECDEEAQPGRDLCIQCFADYHGPDNDLDPESIGGFTYDIQEGT
jgi:hypothetical protein